jgi:hypothetical protein
LVDETTSAEHVQDLLESTPGRRVQDRLDELRDQSSRYLDAVLA